MRIVVFALMLEAAACSSPDDTSSSSSSNCPHDLPASCPAQFPSYTKDIAPIIKDRCSMCHAPGGQEMNKPLVTYQDVYGRRTSVLDQVYACRMPLAGAPQLTLDEREKLLTWLVCDAPDN